MQNSCGQRTRRHLCVSSAQPRHPAIHSGVLQSRTLTLCCMSSECLWVVYVVATGGLRRGSTGQPVSLSWLARVWVAQLLPRLQYVQLASWSCLTFSCGWQASCRICAVTSFDIVRSPKRLLTAALNLSLSCQGAPDSYTTDPAHNVSTTFSFHCHALLETTKTAGQHTIMHGHVKPPKHVCNRRQPIVGFFAVCGVTHQQRKCSTQQLNMPSFSASMHPHTMCTPGKATLPQSTAHEKLG